MKKYGNQEIIMKRLFKPKSVISYDTNRLLHKNTILYSVFFLMTYVRKNTIQFVDYLLLTTCVVFFL